MLLGAAVTARAIHPVPVVGTAVGDNLDAVGAACVFAGQRDEVVRGDRRVPEPGRPRAEQGEGRRVADPPVLGDLDLPARGDVVEQRRLRVGGGHGFSMAVVTGGGKVGRSVGVRR